MDKNITSGKQPRSEKFIIKSTIINAIGSIRPIDGFRKIRIGFLADLKSEYQDKDGNLRISGTYPEEQELSITSANETMNANKREHTCIYT